MAPRVLLLAIALLTLGALVASVELPIKLHPSPWLESVRHSFKTNSRATRDLATRTTLPPQEPFLTDRKHRLVTSIGLGLPPQKFNVAIDPMSSFLWVTDQTCDASGGTCSPYCARSDYCSFTCSSSCCNGHASSTSSSPVACPAANKFNSSATNTYVNEDERSYWVSFFGKAHTYGFAAKDFVYLGDPQGNIPSFTIPLVEFGQATEMTDLTSHESTVHGVLGLGKVNPIHSTIPSILEQAYYTNSVAQWAYTLRTDSANHEGVLTFGGLDKTGCEDGPIPFIENQFFAFNVDNWNVNQKRESDPVKMNGIVDLQQPTISVPKALLDQVANLTGAYYDDSRKVWRIGCGVNIRIAFGNNYDVVFTNSDIVVEVVPRTCVLLLDESSGEHDFVLGAPLLSAYCINVEVATNDMTLGTKKKLN